MNNERGERRWILIFRKINHLLLHSFAAEKKKKKKSSSSSS
jgi:hypothetical protein